jgi:chromosome segregation ATPase
MQINTLTDEELLAQVQNSSVGGRGLVLELVKRLESLLGINDDQETDLTDAHAEIERLKAAVESLTADLDKANDDLESARREVKTLKLRVDELETRDDEEEQ